MNRIIMILIRGIFVIPYWLFKFRSWNKKGNVPIETRYALVNKACTWVVNHANVEMIVSGVETYHKQKVGT